MLSIVCGFTESIPRRKHEAFTLYIAGMIRLHAPMNLFNSNLRLGGGTVLQGTLILMWVVLFSLSGPRPSSEHVTSRTPMSGQILGPSPARLISREQEETSLPYLMMQSTRHITLLLFAKHVLGITGLESIIYKASICNLYQF